MRFNKKTIIMLIILTVLVSSVMYLKCKNDERIKFEYEEEQRRLEEQRIAELAREEEMII